jgi:hypothetical protein
MELFCQATPQGLVPLYDSDYESKHKLQEGKVYKVTVTIPRNYNFHKKFFALVRLTYYNLPESLERSLGSRNEEDLLTALKIDLGMVDLLTIDGHTIVKPHSISFAAMDNAAFETFYNRCIDLILHRYLRGTDRESLIEEIENFK